MNALLKKEKTKFINANNKLDNINNNSIGYNWIIVGVYLDVEIYSCSFCNFLQFNYNQQYLVVSGDPQLILGFPLPHFSISFPA